MKRSGTSLKFQHLGDSSKLKLVIYADVVHRNLSDSANQKGCLL